jgi:Domain of unknown function (DUF4388)
MPLTGKLTMNAADLFQWVSLAQKSGTLVVAHQSVEKKIFFRNGRVISSASNDPREYLGQFLMSYGYLSEPELTKAMEVQRQSGILLGKILVMIDVISEEDLQRLMRRKAEEEIYDVFLWPEGSFHFIEDELPRNEMIPLQVDVTGIVMEGTRRVDEWSRIRQAIDSDDVIPVLQKAIDDASLTDVERTIINAVDGRRTIAEIVLESRSSSFVVSSALTHRIREGEVRLMEAHAAAAAAPVEEIVPAQAAPMSEDEEIVSLLNRAQQALRLRDFEKAQRLLRAAQNLDPNHPKVRASVKGAETVIINELKGAGVGDSRVPKVARPLEELTSMNFTPNEGFLLSRINGTWDIGSLVKISPIREPDALLIFYKLWKDGIIALD